MKLSRGHTSYKGNIRHLVLFKMAEFDVPGVGQEDDVTLPRGTGKPK